MQKTVIPSVARASRFLALAALAWAVGPPEAVAQSSPDIGGGRRILFVRGGSGSGGFLEGGGDGHLSDIGDTSTASGNHGFGELRALLEADGFVVEQVVEGDSPEQPVPLAALDLSQVSVLVLGSNNANYSGADAAAVLQFVESGGGLLVASDANWGSNWGDAPTSDQPFLTPLDLVVNQDRGVYVSRRSSGDFVIGGVDRGGHPILAGVDRQLGTADDIDAFDGEGVSPFTVTSLLPGVDPIVLARAEGTIRLNNNPNGGSTRQAGVADGALVVAEFGSGRVVGHFDRNTFFNLNGAGTSLHRHDNTKYARSLFSWLAGPLVQSYGLGKVSSTGQRPFLGGRGTPSLGGPGFEVVAHNAVPDKVGLFVHGAGYTSFPFQGGTFLIQGPMRMPTVQIDSLGKVVQPLVVTGALVGTRRYFQFWFRDPADPTGFGSGLSDGLSIAFTP